ncbi:MAG: hypothetical protein Q4F38_05535 [Akkermansia sp.]|nr:hypothetical protein [Akkermansia sp.]
MEDEQSEFKKEIKQWLREQGLDYRWLAEQCGVSEITVRNWMSQRNIPTLRRQLLERVMVQLPGVSRENTGDKSTGVSVRAGFTLTVQLDSTVYTKLEARALEENTTVEQLVAHAITAAAEKSTTHALQNRKVILPID